MKGTEDIVRQNFERFFKQHYQRLCSYAYSYMKDDETSEDIVQDIFIRVWEQRQDLIGSEQLKFYLFAATSNNCLSRLQKNKKNPHVELTDEDSPDEISIQLEPGDKKLEPKALIAKAMEQLPAKCKEVFLLSRLSNQSYQQIADNLGISVKTVENHMGKALKILRAFAKENKMYFFALLNLAGANYLVHAIGVFIEKWFY
jgi:RNA polymerase sigma-70 factor (ECF subfamily)